MKAVYALITMLLLAPNFSHAADAVMQASKGNPEMKNPGILNANGVSARTHQPQMVFITRTYNYRRDFEKDLVKFGRSGWSLGGCITSDYSTNSEWIYDRYVSLPYARTSYCVFQREK